MYSDEALGKDSFGLRNAAGGNRLSSLAEEIARRTRS